MEWKYTDAIWTARNGRATYTLSQYRSGFEVHVQGHMGNPKTGLSLREYLGLAGKFEAAKVIAEAWNARHMSS
jgi:hypothetical protein